MRSIHGPLERAQALQRRSFAQACALATALSATLGLPAVTHAQPRAQRQPDEPRIGAASRWFTTSDGVRLHYLDTGQAQHGGAAPTLAFVPGWTMPGWIWQRQIEHFAPRHRVLALDPRGQGHSQLAATGYDHGRRAGDIAEWLQASAAGREVVLVGWSLAVLECLQLVHDARLAGAPPPLRALVLVDNSVGVGDPPTGDPTFFDRLRKRRRQTVAGFVASMFKHPPDPDWLEQLTTAALRTPLGASIELLRQPRAREFWRDSLFATPEPVLYAYSPRFAQQGEIVKARRPQVQTHLFADAGHALFVDEAAAFNEVLARFIERHVPATGAPR